MTIDQLNLMKEAGENYVSSISSTELPGTYMNFNEITGSKYNMEQQKHMLLSALATKDRMVRDIFTQAQYMKTAWDEAKEEANKIREELSLTHGITVENQYE